MASNKTTAYSSSLGFPLYVVFRILDSLLSSLFGAWNLCVCLPPLFLLCGKRPCVCNCNIVCSVVVPAGGFWNTERGGQCFITAAEGDQNARHLPKKIHSCTHSNMFRFSKCRLWQCIHLCVVSICLPASACTICEVPPPHLLLLLEPRVATEARIKKASFVSGWLYWVACGGGLGFSDPNERRRRRRRRATDCNLCIRLSFPYKKEGIYVGCSDKLWKLLQLPSN